MMNNIVKSRFHTVFFFGIYLMAQGCTNVSVKPLSDKDDNIGFRYYLPQPYILVTPSDDGKAIKSVEVKNLPDYQRGYVIHGWSFMATHDLTVDTSDGLLSKVHLETDSTAIANTLLEKGGSLGTELIALNAQLEAAEKKAKENSAKNQLKEKDLEKDLEKIERYRPSLFKVEVTRKVDYYGTLNSSTLKLVDFETTIGSKKFDVIQVLPQSVDSSNSSNTSDSNTPPPLN